MQIFIDIWDKIVLVFKDYFLNTFKDGIRVVDVLDILILAFIFYFIYCFIRNRRAGKLALGLLLVMALFVLSSALDMYALEYILQNFYQIGLIAVLIVFQPELRAALEKVGGTSFSGLKNITVDSRELAALSNEIEVICSAVSDLSRDKVGALIVIERTTKLGEYIKSGVIVDSALSPQILKNIFFNKAPLHDGAVIIRDKRVYAAGCFLPLSMQDDIHLDLGTRHRAAIGLSETSDALIIVVSEETGNISMAFDGNLKRNYNYTSLKQELNTILSHQVHVEHTKKHSKKESEKEDK